MKKYVWFVSVALTLAATLACGGGGRNAPAPVDEGSVAERLGTTCGLRADLNLRVRTCPDAALPAIGTLPQDARVPVVGRTEDALWWQIRVRTGTFWVYGGWATMLGDCTSVPVSACAGTVPAPAGQAAAPGAGDSGPLPECGDQACDIANGESCAVCVADCGLCEAPAEAAEGAAGSLCGDGICQEGESSDWCGDCVEAEEAQQAPQEAAQQEPQEVAAEAPAAGCGDGACNFPAEDCFSCPADCTLCSIEVAGCGDSVCQSNDPILQESCSSCQRDCGPCTECGDGLCQGSEAVSCPDDCGEENLLWGDWFVLQEQEGDDDTLVSIEAEDLVSCGDGFCTFYERFEGMNAYCPQDCG